MPAEDREPGAAGDNRFHGRGGTPSARARCRPPASRLLGLAVLVARTRHESDETARSLRPIRKRRSCRRRPPLENGDSCSPWAVPSHSLRPVRSAIHCGSSSGGPTRRHRSSRSLGRLAARFHGRGSGPDGTVMRVRAHHGRKQPMDRTVCHPWVVSRASRPGTDWLPFTTSSGFGQTSPPGGVRPRLAGHN